MDGCEIKNKEVDISIDDHPKLAKIRDYWTEEQTLEMVNLLKEYQDVFARDYKYSFRPSLKYGRNENKDSS